MFSAGDCRWIVSSGIVFFHMIRPDASAFILPWQVLGRTSDVDETGVFGFFIAPISAPCGFPDFPFSKKSVKNVFFPQKV